MAERQNLNSKLLPSTFYGLIARLFLASTIITSGTIFISRNQDREPSNRIDTLLSNNHLSIYPNVSNIAVVERKTDRSYELQIIDSKGNKKLIFDTLQGDSLSQLSWSPYDKNKFMSRQMYDRFLVRTLNDYRYDLVVLAGWMHVLSNEFIKDVKGIDSFIINAIREIRI